MEWMQNDVVRGLARRRDGQRTIHARRMTLGLTLTELARMAHLDTRTVSLVDHGQPVSEASLAKIEAALREREEAAHPPELTD